MATDFPASPSNGDTHAGFTYNSTTGAWESSAAGGGSGSGVTSHANLAAFPASPSEGDLAYAEDTDALYLRKASTWERVYTGTDEVLSFDNDPAASIVLLQDGTATTVNLPATDPEGFPITYSHDTNPSNQAQATITNSGATYTITPSTTASDAGNFTLRFKATDGLHSISKTSAVQLAFSPIVDYLVVGGGGGGSGGDNSAAGGGGGGGGAGGLLSGTSLTLADSTTYTITVGTGGTGGNFQANGQSGADSSIAGSGLTTITATGGGRGGNHVTSGAAGGSGGGGGGRGQAGGAGTSGQGNSGGNGGSPYAGGGGGGGAGAVGGATTSSDGGVGGVGVSSSITGTAVYYAGGGGGGKNGGSNGAGGNGGGGSWATSPDAVDGTGGGGGGQPAGSNSGGAGGDGVVILRTLKAHSTVTTSGTVTHSTDGSYNIYKFTGNGTIGWT